MNTFIETIFSILFFFGLIFLGVNIADYFDNLFAKNLIMASAVIIWAIYLCNLIITVFSSEIRRPSIIVSQGVFLALFALLIIGFDPRMIDLGSNWYRTTPMREIYLIQSDGLFEDRQWWIWRQLAILGFVFLVMSGALALYIALALLMKWPLPENWDRHALEVRDTERRGLNPHHLKAENKKLRQQLNDIQNDLSILSDQRTRLEKENAALISQRAQDKTDRESDRMKFDRMTAELDQAQKDIERLTNEIERLNLQRQNASERSPDNLPPGYTIRPDEHPLKTSKKTET